MTQKRRFISRKEEDEIVAAIQEAEQHTSGEIRVHIEPSCPGDIRERVEYLFHKLEMKNTKERNGVLFYLAPNDHQFYILGDKGIHDKVTQDFWESTAELMQSHFKKGAFVEGLVKGILEAGEQLKNYFPHQSDDINELPDEISRG